MINSLEKFYIFLVMILPAFAFGVATNTYFGSYLNKSERMKLLKRRQKYLQEKRRGEEDVFAKYRKEKTRMDVFLDKIIERHPWSRYIIVLPALAMLGILHAIPAIFLFLCLIVVVLVEYLMQYVLAGSDFILYSREITFLLVNSFSLFIYSRRAKKYSPL